MRYFELYKKYYDVLDEGIVSKSASLAEIVSQTATSTSMYANKINSNAWNESGSPLIKNSVLSNIDSSCTKLSNFINDKLVSVCGMAINKLLPTIKEIKKNDESLDQVECKLSTIITNKNRIESELRYLRRNDEENVRISHLNSSLRSLSSQISSLSSERDNIIKILVGLCEEANTTISSILMLNGYSKSQVSGMLPVYDISNDSLTYTDVSSGRMDVIGIERITDDEEGPYFMVKLSNGRSFKLYDQYKWAGKKLRIKRNKEINMGGSGCSIFALGTTLQYLTGNMDITMKDVTRANGGQFYGFHEMYSGNDVLEVNGVKYTVDSDVSDKKIYGASSDKTEVLNDWEETLNKGGIIYLNATKRKKGYVDYRGRKVDSSTLREMTGIASEEGHIIAIMGIDSNNEIIFADSMLHFDGNSDNYEYGLHKNLTLEEFYDIYGGTRPTYVTSRYYYTVTEATLVPVE